MYNGQMSLAPATLSDNDPQPAVPTQGIDVTLDDGESPPQKTTYDPLSGIAITVSDNGDVEIDFDGKKTMAAKDTSFSANLAEKLDDYELAGLCDDILRGIQNDIETRAQLEKTYDRGIDLLGLTLDFGVLNVAQVRPVIAVEPATAFRASFHHF